MTKILHLHFTYQRTLTAIQPDCVDVVKKNFVTSVNNENKMYPPLYLTPIEYEYDGKVILPEVED